MKSREYRYIKTKELIKVAKGLQVCPEFPHFGAHYPDACCIDGRLWDLDSGDSNGLTRGGGDPCPRCNIHEYIQDGIDCEVPFGKIYAHLLFIFNRY